MLSKKIFNRFKQIPFGEIIHTSGKDGRYLFVGIRDKRTKKECVIYTVPNNNEPEKPNIKAIERDEADLLWGYLLQHGKLKTSDFRILTPELMKEGACCVSAFFGMVKKIYPDDFGKGHGIIFKK
jgi:hypothetical protein